MLDLNLLNPEIKSNLKKLKVFYLLRKIFVYIFSATLMLTVLMVLSFFLLNENLTQINERIKNEKIISTRQSSISMDEIIKSLNTQLAQINEIQTSYIKWSKLLNEFNDIVPSKVSLNLLEISATTNTTRITGTSADRQILLDFQESLNAFPYMKDLNFPFSNLAQQNQINFEVSGKLTDIIHE